MRGTRAVQHTRKTKTRAFSVRAGWAFDLRLFIAAVIAGVVLVPAARGVAAQPTLEGGVTPASAERYPVNFLAGERLKYDVKFGSLRVGSGSMEVLGTQDVRGREAWHTRFTVKGGVPFFSVNDRLESWIDTRTFSSLRFVQDLEEGRRDREYTFEIFPELAQYQEKRDTAPKPSVSNPLDDGAFIYFVRTIPLEIGKTYDINRYFVPDRNPVQVKVLRRETITVPAGTFKTIVVRPIINARGLFSDKGRAELWFTDDDRRLLVQMKSHLSIGSLNLYLRNYTAGGFPTTSGFSGQ